MKIGTQIAYVPFHANGKITHPAVEFGFVTGESANGEFQFCRYWRNGRVGAELRTTANSEATPNYALIEFQSVPQPVIDELLIKLEYTKPFRVTKARD